MVCCKYPQQPHLLIEWNIAGYMIYIYIYVHIYGPVSGGPPPSPRDGDSLLYVYKLYIHTYIYIYIYTCFFYSTTYIYIYIYMHTSRSSFLACLHGQFLGYLRSVPGLCWKFLVLLFGCRCAHVADGHDHQHRWADGDCATQPGI